MADQESGGLAGDLGALLPGVSSPPEAAFRRVRFHQAPEPSKGAWSLTVAMLLRLPKLEPIGVNQGSVASSLHPKMFQSTEGPGKKQSGAKGGGPHREG